MRAEGVEAIRKKHPEFRCNAPDRRMVGAGTPLLLGALFLALSFNLGGCRTDPENEVVVFAAASLRDVLEEMAPRFEETGFRPVFNFAGSNVLAHQIEASSVADVFLSADEAWMDFLQQRGRLVNDSRRVFLSNRLVVVAHPRSNFGAQQPADLARTPFRFLSIGDPRAVPAGRYAKAFLENVRVGESTLWDALGDRLAPAPDVRAALGLVEARTDTVGIVYASDVGKPARLKVLFEVGPELHPEIRYSAAMIKDADNPPGGAAFLDFLGRPTAALLFEAHGFLLVGGDEGGKHNP